MPPQKSSLPRRLALGCGVTVLVVVIAVVLLFMAFDKPLPTGEVSAEADQLARSMMAAVDVDAWQRTGAVEWNFAGRQQHLWDRQRGFSRVRFGDAEVLLDLGSRRGVASQAGQRLSEQEAAPLLEKAWSFWCNDSFWLNPVAKLFDDGTTRALVPLDDGGQGLLISYASGGVTPGDSYLWTSGADGTPESWSMWTQILPLGGVEASWDGWITLDTGARISTQHKIGVLDLELTDVRGAATLAELAGEDPFAPLVELLQGDGRGDG